MEIKESTTAFGALSQETRLQAFRLLVKTGTAGLPAGRIAQALKVPPSTLSGHLQVLERAGLVQSWRVERQIFYAVEVRGIRALVDFLTTECCQGQPELCGLDSVETGAARKSNASG